MRVLIVEDNEMNRDMLKRRLQFRGFEVDCAADGAEGLEAAASMPDVILMDMSLPVIDGWEATRRLKAEEATKAIPVVALTAHALKEDQERALRAGCDGFHPKPIEMEELIKLIENLVSRK
jgi:two-component system, cell cycle response regulator DivK